MVQQKDVIMEAFKSVPEDSILYLSVDADNYYVTMLAAMEHVKNTLELPGIYVTASRSAERIRSQLKLEKIDAHKLYYVDTIAILSGTRTSHPAIQMVESPAMLETIILKIKWFLRHIKDESRFVFLDSINALAVYNEPKLMCEFLHVLINLMSTRDVMTILFAVKEQTPQDVQQVLKLSSDDVIEVTEEGVSLNGKLLTMIGPDGL